MRNGAVAGMHGLPAHVVWRRRSVPPESGGKKERAAAVGQDHGPERGDRSAFGPACSDPAILLGCRQVDDGWLGLFAPPQANSFKPLTWIKEASVAPHYTGATEPGVHAGDGWTTRNHQCELSLCLVVEHEAPRSATSRAGALPMNPEEKS